MIPIIIPIPGKCTRQRWAAKISAGAAAFDAKHLNGKVGVAKTSAGEKLKGADEKHGISDKTATTKAAAGAKFSALGRWGSGRRAALQSWAREKRNPVTVVAAPGEALPTFTPEESSYASGQPRFLLVSVPAAEEAPPTTVAATPAYSKMSGKALKAACTARALEPGANKKQMVARLQAADVVEAEATAAAKAAAQADEEEEAPLQRLTIAGADGEIHEVIVPRGTPAGSILKVPVEDVVPKKSSKERSDLKAGIIGGK